MLVKNYDGHLYSYFSSLTFECLDFSLCGKGFNKGIIFIKKNPYIHDCLVIQIKIVQTLKSEKKYESLLKSFSVQIDL